MSAVAAIQGVLREQVPRIVGNDQRSDKQLGRVIGMTPRNVRGWRERAHGISAAALLALALPAPGHPPRAAGGLESALRAVVAGLCAAARRTQWMSRG